MRAQVVSALDDPAENSLTKLSWATVLTRGHTLQDGRTPLIMAAFVGDMEVAQVLLKAGANKEAKDEVRMIRGGEGGGVG